MNVADTSSVHVYFESRSMVAEGRRTIQFLNTIENTIDATGSTSLFLEALIDNVSKLEARVRNLQDRGELIDPEGEVEEIFVKSQDALLRIRNDFASRMEGAQADSRINDDDGLVEAFQNALELTESLYDGHSQLLIAIREKDADRSPVVESFDSADDLIKYLENECAEDNKS